MSLATALSGEMQRAAQPDFSNKKQVSWLDIDAAVRTYGETWLACTSFRKLIEQKKLTFIRVDELREYLVSGEIQALRPWHFSLLKMLNRVDGQFFDKYQAIKKSGVLEHGDVARLAGMTRDEILSLPAGEDFSAFERPLAELISLLHGKDDANKLAVDPVHMSSDFSNAIAPWILVFGVGVHRIVWALEMKERLTPHAEANQRESILADRTLNDLVDIDQAVQMVEALFVNGRNHPLEDDEVARILQAIEPFDVDSFPTEEELATRRVERKAALHERFRMEAVRPSQTPDCIDNTIPLAAMAEKKPSMFQRFIRNFSRSLEL